MGTFDVVRPDRRGDGRAALRSRRECGAGRGPARRGREPAQAFQKLGSQVTLIEGEPRVLPNHEEFARVQLTTALGQDGVEILTGRRVVRLGRNGDAYVVTTSDDGAAEADVWKKRIQPKERT